MCRQILSTLPLFTDCPADEIERLASYTEIISHKRYCELYHEGAPSEYVHIVLEGEVCLEKDRGEDTEPMRLTIVQAGEVFGLGEFMLPTCYTTATTLTPCRLIRIANDDFKRHFLAIESIRTFVLSSLSHIARYLMFSLISGTGTRQLACYLWQRCRDDAEEHEEAFHIQSKVHQPELASLLNMSREHVSRLFSRLHTEGAVDFNRGFPIVNKKWLNEMVTDRDLAARIVYRDYPQ
jgi:CRP-like cAMP-binding protein